VKNKIIIIGKRGLIGSNLNSYLKIKNNTTSLDYKDFINKKEKFINNFDYVINCTSNKNYINKRYLKKNDFDLIIAKKIEKLNIKMVMLSSRKVYKVGNNLSEFSPLGPKNYYSKNKLMTEKVLMKILKKNVLILRISNIIGINKRRHNKLHKIFIDIFLENIKKGLIFDNKDSFKDFISIDKFCEIIEKLIKSNAHGIFNISLGKKVYLKQLINWLNFYNKKRVKFIKLEKTNQLDNFILNNNKLMNRINVKNTVKDLKSYCIQLSRKLFKK
jgi:nucleoside-diphosphate-sugar epimerase